MERSSHSPTEGNGGHYVEGKLHSLITEYRNLAGSSEKIAEALENADPRALAESISAGDDSQIAEALDIPLEDLLALGTHFYDVAQRLAESFPELRDAAEFFAAKPDPQDDEQE